VVKSPFSSCLKIERAKRRLDPHLLNSLAPSKIKEILQRDFYFPNSIVTLSEGEAKTLFEECKKLFN